MIQSTLLAEEAAVSATPIDAHVVIETYQDHPIEFRRGDGYLNLTALCRVFGKRAHDFLRRPSPNELLVSLAEKYPKLR